MDATRTLEDVAIVIRPEKDNVAVVTVDFLEKGNTLNYRGESLTISGRVLRGQSFAIKKVGEGEPYVTLGDPIGLASRAVEPGDPISESNLEDRLPKLAVRYRDNPGQPEADPGLASLTFDGFVRPDGSIGARNYVGVVTSGMCSSTEAHEITEKRLGYANQFTRQPAPISKLVVGTKCGGSDRWSGVTANPAVGVAADMFVKAGAAVFLPEIPELQGAAMVDLAERARTRAVGRKLMQALKRYEAYVHMFGDDFRDNPSPGNVKGGLYNIYLKSSGVKAKGGTSIV